MSAPGFQLDHAVVVVADLEAAVAEWSALGFAVEPGGTHPRGSVNALISFADGSYIELIAYPRPAPDQRWWRVLQQDGPGLVDAALLPRDLDAALAHARKAGLSYGPPQDGGRERPDGATLVWRTARPETTDLPFFCADVTERALRVPAPPQHPNGIAGIAVLSIAVSDLGTSAARWEALTGLRATQVGALPGLDAAAAFLDLGSTRVTLVAPELASAGPVGGRIARRGEGPLGLAFRTVGGHVITFPAGRGPAAGASRP